MMRPITMSNESWDLLDLRRLRHLVTVADVGSFTAAADELGLSQPGLSSSIRRLEEEVGTALLQRAARRAYPTPAGAHLVQAARGILAAATDARAQVRAVAGLQAGELTLAACRPSPRWTWPISSPAFTPSIQGCASHCARTPAPDCCAPWQEGRWTWRSWHWMRNPCRPGYRRYAATRKTWCWAPALVRPWPD